MAAPGADAHASDFDTLLRTGIQFANEQASTKPAMTLISTVAFAALGMIAVGTVSFILPIPIIMPVLATAAQAAITAATFWMVSNVLHHASAHVRPA